MERSGSVTTIALSGITASLDGSVSVTDGRGALVVIPDANAALAGVAGFFSGTSGGVTASVRLNTTTGAVDQSIDAAGTPMHIVFGSDEGSLFEIALSGALSFGPVSIEGDIVWSSRSGVEVFAGTNLTVFFGQGPLVLDNGERNPFARGLLIDDAVVGIVRNTSGKYALDVRGVTSLIGTPGVDIAGLVHVRFNDLGAVDQTMNLASGGTVAVTFTATDAGTVSGTGLVLDVAGQRLSGDLTVTRTATGLKIVVANLEAKLSAGGTEFLTLTNGAGVLTTGPNGIRTTTADGTALAPLSGKVALTLPGAALTGLFSLTVGHHDGRAHVLVRRDRRVADRRRGHRRWLGHRLAHDRERHGGLPVHGDRAAPSPSPRPPRRSA